MLVRQLFDKDRDPTRTLNEVVDAEQDIDVRSEIDEYVFTDHTREYLRTLIEGVLDTGQGVTPDCLRGWISGFFGSGKSHFLKLAAALLENRSIQVGGADQRALEYAVARHRLDLPWQRVAREFHIKAVRINLALAHGGGRQAQEQPLLYRLSSELNRAWGFSPIPHIAEIEREIHKAKKWPAFLEAVKKHHQQVGFVDDDGAALSWDHPDIRTKAADAHQALEAVLPSILPRYHNARAYIEDKENHKPSPEEVVRLALEIANEAHSEMGRMLLCLDEVALYLRGTAGTFDADRVSQVQGLAETVKNKGKGKVFLFATAQLSVETVDNAFAASSSYVNFLKDRFPKGGRLELVESDIDTVVRERWLKKDSTTSAYTELHSRLTKPGASGTGTEGDVLARAAKLHDETVVRAAPLLTDPEAVLAYYPFLPYHVRLLQRVLAALRREKQIDQTAAQSRALLTAVRSMFVRQNGAALADRELGTLVTFDQVYDVIRDVVRKRDSQTDLWITENITPIPACGSIAVASVAKVIFLLQHLNGPDHRGIRVDPENVAALLYPRLGAPWEPHLKDVRDACNVLLDQHFIGDDTVNGFRFYRKDERTFQSDVEAQSVDAGKRRQVLSDAIHDKAAALGMKHLPYSSWHKIPVDLRVHIEGTNLPDPNAEPKGMELHLVWPKPGLSPQQIKMWAAQYKNAGHVAIWVLSRNDVEILVDRSLKLAATITDYQQRHGQQTVDLLRGEQGRLSSLKEQQIPETIERAIAEGTLIHGGVDSALAGQLKKPADVFRDVLRRAVGDVFTEIDVGLAQVDEAGLKKVFSWRPGQAQPDFFGKLRLFDSDAHALVDKPFLKELILVIKGQSEAQRTGAALLEHFSRIPFGWPERAVKAGLGALLRGRQIAVKLGDGGTLRNEKDGKAETWLTGTQQFNRGIIELSNVTLTMPEREQLTALFAHVFQEPGADRVEKLEQAAQKVVPDYLARAREAFADVHGRRLPGGPALKAFVTLLEAANEPDTLLGKLKQLIGRAHELAVGGVEPHVALAPSAELVRAVQRLRTHEELDALAAAHARSTTLYPTWKSREAAADIEALRAIAESERLLLNAADALQRDRGLFERFARDYRHAHEALQKRIAEALQQITAHSGWASATVDMQEQLRKPIASLECLSPGDLVLPADGDGVCRECRRHLEDLLSKAELVDHRLLAGMKKLDELARPEQTTKKASRRPPPPGDVSLDLQSPDDLPKLYERIAQEAQRVTSWPRRVRISFVDPNE